MIRNQFIFDLHDEILVDNFAGGGGASTGIERALGRHLDIAINHDADAIAMHRANHPQTLHLTEDVFAVDPVKVTGGRRVGLAWFSPDCTDFSKAKGGKPRRKKIRGLAWVMVKWAAAFKKAGLPMPRVMYLENVEEFQDWGPLLPDGTRCPKRIAQTFRRFVSQLRNLGYTVEWRELRAKGYGAGTTRNRLYLIARCDGQPIAWPEDTHGPKRRKPYRIAAQCIDWGIPCPSIFLTNAEGKVLGVKRPLVDATMRRIARGIRKFVMEAKDPFILPAFITEHANGSCQRNFSVQEPLRTQCAEVKGGHFALVTPHITKFRTGATGHSVNEPLHTITAGPKENPAGAAHAMGVVQAELKPAAEHSSASPARTAAVTAFLAKHFGGHETPGSQMKKPFDTITAKDHHALIAAHVVRSFGESVGSSAAAPVGTTTANGGGKTAIAVSHLTKYYGTNIGTCPSEPLRTITSQAGKFAEVRAFLIKYYGEGGQDQKLSDPMHTISTKHRLGLVTIHGEDYIITDIGMRMLKPRELFNAQGFPADYIIDPIVPRKRGKKIVHVPLPQNGQVRMCGNSVCPPVATALVRANNPELCIRSDRKRRRIAA